MSKTNSQLIFKKNKEKMKKERKSGRRKGERKRKRDRVCSINIFLNGGKKKARACEVYYY